MAKNKKRLALLTAILLIFSTAFAFTAKARAAAFYPDIRVLLSVPSGGTIELGMIGDYTLREDPSFKLSDKATLSIVGSRPVLTSGKNTFTASSITFLSGDYSGTSAYIRLENAKYGMCTYLGNMSFTAGEGKISAVNTLPTEHYLYGVVPHEMSNTFPVESLKTQAVCARGYAVSNCSKYRMRSYDILDTSADQVYHGYASKYNRAIDAVNETAGQVLTYDGDIIQAYYSASNGGQTELSGNVWTSDLPYYVQRDDIYDVQNPSSLEDKSFIPSQFNDETIKLLDPIVLGMLQDGADNAAGGPVTLLSTVRVKAHTAKFNPPSRCYTKADVVLMAQTQDGKTGQITVTLTLDNLLFSEKNTKGVFNTTKTTLRMRGAEPGMLTANGKDYDGWFLTNRRYGHGVGMSQRGAQQRATGAQSYTDIMGFYYADTRLCTMGSFETAPKLTSGSLSISKDFISGIAPGTTAEKLLAQITCPGGEISVISFAGAKKTGAVATGDFVRTVYDGGAFTYDLPLLVYGDIDGDAKISQGDLDALRQHLMNTNRLNGITQSAADVSRDGEVGSLDVLLLLKHLQGAGQIKQGGLSD